MRRGLAVLVLVGCSSAPATPLPVQCAPTHDEVNGLCVPRFGVCDERSVPMLGGGCVRVGVDDCGPGFAADDRGGCTPVLPTAPCADGELALPGEPACHPLAACGTGRFGDDPLPTPALWVDAAASPTGANGSQAHPFVRISDALAVTSPVSTILVAGGRYEETLSIDKRVELIGRCPSKVEVVGGDASTKTFAVTIGPMGAGSKVRGLSITGPWGGISSAGGTLEAIRVHDVGFDGFHLTSGVAGSALIAQRTRHAGLVVERGDYSLRHVLVDDVAPIEGAARGIDVAQIDGNASSFALEHAVIASVNGTSLSVVGGESIDVKQTVIRGSPAASGPTSGFVVDTKGLPPGLRVTVDQTVFDGGLDAGIDVRGEASLTVTRTSIRDLVSAKGGAGGAAIRVSDGAHAGISNTFVGGAGRYGIASFHAADVTVHHVIVRDIVGSDTGEGGMGVVSAWYSLASATKAPSLVVGWTRIADVHTCGICTFATDTTVADSILEHVAVEPFSGTFGDGVGFASAWIDELRPVRVLQSLQRTVVRGASRAGVAVFGGEATVGDTRFDCASVDMDVEPYVEGGSSFDGSLADRGSNVCGCSVATSCKVQSASLEPNLLR